MARSAKGWRMAGKSTWIKFCDENPGIKLSYVEFQNIVYGFNEGFRDYILETGYKTKLPYGFGDFVILKKKGRRLKKHRITGDYVPALNIDWKKTKEIGTYYYHMNDDTEGFQFSIRWWNRSARFSFSDTWSFRPSRVSSRLLTYHLRKDPNNQYKYQEWLTLR